VADENIVSPEQLGLVDPHRLFGGRGPTPYNPSALAGRKGLNMGLPDDWQPLFRNIRRARIMSRVGKEDVRHEETGIRPNAS
jgi:hypothetical protein